MKKLIISIGLLFVVFVHANSQQKNLESNNYQLLDSLYTQLSNQVNTDSMLAYISDLQAFGTRYLYADNHREIAMWLVSKFHLFGYQQVSIDSFSIGDRWFHNIYVDIPGSINPDQNIIFGAHWDSISDEPYENAPGADDNASGTAAVLELARVLKEANYIPELTLKFVLFDAEEVGLVGSEHFVETLTNQESDIRLYLNNDMIGYTVNPEQYRLIPYDNATWATETAAFLCDRYSLLVPTINSSSAGSSDSYSFYNKDIPAIYFAEWGTPATNPFYHSTHDSLIHLNPEYLSKITKIDLSILIYYTTMPFQIDQLEASQPGTGSSIELSWHPVINNDFSYYEVIVMDTDHNILQNFNTTENHTTINNLTANHNYTFTVKAVDTDENMGLGAYVNKRPTVVLMEKEIGLICESFGGILNPDESEIINYYQNVLSGFTYEKIEYTNNSISLEKLGKFKTLFWTVNKYSSTPTIFKNSLTEIKDYLKLGGNLILMGDKPALYLQDEFVVNTMQHFGSTDFFSEYLGIDSAYIKAISLFTGAHSTLQPPSYLALDTLKTSETDNYDLQLIAQGLFPSHEAATLLNYHSNFDENTPQGEMNGLPVAVLNNQETFTTLSIGFPLYYIAYEASKDFVHNVLKTYFNQQSHSISFKSEKTSIIWPNPVRNTMHIQSPDHTEVSQIEIYDLMGHRLLRKTVTNSEHHVNLQLLDKGIYLLKLKTNLTEYSKTFIKL